MVAIIEGLEYVAHNDDTHHITKYELYLPPRVNIIQGKLNRNGQTRRQTWKSKTEMVGRLLHMWISCGSKGHRSSVVSSSGL